MITENHLIKVLRIAASDKKTFPKSKIFHNLFNGVTIKISPHKDISLDEFYAKFV